MPYLVKGKPSDIFMRIWMGQDSWWAVKHKCQLQPSFLETNYGKAVDLILHSQSEEQALKLLLPVKGYVTPTERLAFGSPRRDVSPAGMLNSLPVLPGKIHWDLIHLSFYLCSSDTRAGLGSTVSQLFLGILTPAATLRIVLVGNFSLFPGHGLTQWK